MSSDAIGETVQVWRICPQIPTQYFFSEALPCLPRVTVVMANLKFLETSDSELSHKMIPNLVQLSVSYTSSDKESVTTHPEQQELILIAKIGKPYKTLANMVHK